MRNVSFFKQGSLVSLAFFFFILFFFFKYESCMCLFFVCGY